MDTSVLSCANRVKAYLERKACAEHQHQNKLKILVYGPERLHHPLSVRDEELQSCWREHRVREGQSRIEENGGAEDYGAQKLALASREAWEHKRNYFVQDDGAAEKKAGVARHLDRRDSNVIRIKGPPWCSRHEAAE